MNRKNSVGALLLATWAIVHAQIPISMNGPLPASIDNSSAKYLPAIIDQGMRESCAHAAGIGYVFAYEINAARNASGKSDENRYPFFYTYDFQNDGSEQNGNFRMFLSAWNVGRENGIANAVDFGSDLTSTRWVSGFDRYFRIMRNRVDKIDSFQIVDTGSIRKMKQWLRDHGNGSDVGGLLLFTVYMYGNQEIGIPSGAEAGKSMIVQWGPSDDSTSRHALTIVGYNDSVRYDFNDDGKCTNTLDIGTSGGKLSAKDGKVDPADWEVGAVKFVNSWGSSWGSGGYSYMPYRSLFIPAANGGILSNNRLYFISVKKDYTPRAALKVSITHSKRNTVALSVGVAPDPQASAPAKIRSFRDEFAYSGGAYPMCGKDASSSIEIGLDVSDLLDSIGSSGSAKFFLAVDSKSSGGTVDSLSLMDYTGGTLVQTKSPQTKVAIAPGSAANPARTLVGVAWTRSGAVVHPGEMLFPAAVTVAQRGGLFIVRSAMGVTSAALFDAAGRPCPFARFSRVGENLLLVGNLPAGVYFVSVTTASGETLIRKLIGRQVSEKNSP